MLYLHGGGFVIGCLETHDSLCRQLALRSGGAVVALDYRLAPEHRVSDRGRRRLGRAAMAGCAMPARMGLDGARLAVGGDSAGGTLAAVCALQARDHGLPLALQLLITPGTTAHGDTASRRLFANGFLLDAATIDWFFDHYIEHAHRRDWRFAPLNARRPGRRGAGLCHPCRVRPAGRRRPGLCRPAARGRRAGGAGAVPRRDARLHQDGPRAEGSRRTPSRRQPTRHERGMESMNRAEFRFFDRLRVRWAEVDMQKIVFNGHYLMYFDTAVAGYWRALAMPYHETMDAPRRRPVRAQGHARIPGVGALRRPAGRRHPLRAHRQLVDPVRRGGLPRRRRCWSAANWSMCSPTRRRRPRCRCRRSCATLLQDFEAGKPMVDVRLGTWDELGREAQAIRTAVFVQEQQIPAELEWDAADASCVHAVAYNRFGMALATGRLLNMRRRGQDRPHGGAADDARRRRRPRAARRAGAGCARQRGEQRCCCTRRRARRASTPAPASRPAAAPSTRPASRTWRWCAPCSDPAVSGVQGVEHLDMPCAAQPALEQRMAAWSMSWRSASSMPGCGCTDSIA